MSAEAFIASIKRVDRHPRSARFFVGRAGFAALLLALTPVAAHAQPLSNQFAADEIGAAMRSVGGSERGVRDFYQGRGYRPLWIRGSALGPEAGRFLDIVETADVDGLDVGDYRPRALAAAIDRARDGSPRSLARAEMLLSRSFSQYVADLRSMRPTGMVYVDRELAPVPITSRAALEGAAAAPSLLAYLDASGWMNPIYGQLRGALADERARPDGRDERREALLRLNLQRARALPADTRRHIVVDAAGARLWMYENGRVRDSMRVVVGKPTEQTPVMAGLIRFAMVNPYWNIPPDLVRLRVAPGAIAQGPAFLKTKRFEVLSDWTDEAKPLDPATVDWRAVQSGRREVRVRQLPGKDNAMGRMKFMFPNDLGIYLHDTPDRQLFGKAERRESSGCVRVEDAPRLAKWLFGKPLTPKPGAREKQVNLASPVPVYITYLTAAPEGRSIVFRPDVYGRDAAALGRSRSLATR